MSEKEYKFVKMHDGAGFGDKEGEFVHQVELEADGWIACITGPANEDYSDFKPGFDVRNAEIHVSRINLWSIFANPVAWDLRILKVGEEQDEIKIMDSRGKTRTLTRLENDTENEEFEEMLKMLRGLDAAVRAEYPGYCLINKAN